MFTSYHFTPTPGQPTSPKALTWFLTQPCHQTNMAPKLMQRRQWGNRNPWLPGRSKELVAKGRGAEEKATCHKGTFFHIRPTYRYEENSVLKGEIQNRLGKRQQQKEGRWRKLEGAQPKSGGRGGPVPHILSPAPSPSPRSAGSASTGPREPRKQARGVLMGWEGGGRLWLAPSAPTHPFLQGPPGAA